MATLNSNSVLTNEIPNRSFLRVCAVLTAIEQHDKPSLEDLVVQTDFPKRSIFAIIQRLQGEYNVVIKREFGRRYGYYSVVDWGLLNREKILAFMSFRSAESHLANSREEQHELPLD